MDMLELFVALFEKFVALPREGILTFVTTTTVCYDDLYAMYIDNAKSFEWPEFKVFNDFVLGTSDFAPTAWFYNLNTGEECLGMHINGATHPMHVIDKDPFHARKYMPVLHVKLGFVVGDVKRQMKGQQWGLLPKFTSDAQHMTS